MSVDGEHGEAVDEEEERIESLRQQEAKDKSPSPGSRTSY